MISISKIYWVHGTQNFENFICAGQSLKQVPMVGVCQEDLADSEVVLVMLKPKVKIFKTQLVQVLHREKSLQLSMLTDQGLYI